MIKIKNISGEALELHLYSFDIDELYTIEDEDRESWASNDDTLSAISDGSIQIYDEDDPITGVSSQIDFLKNKSNIPVDLQGPKDSEGRSIFSNSPFSDAGGFRFRGTSFKDTVPTGTSKNIDFELTEARYINGGRLIVDNIGDDDTVTFQVVDVNNIFGLGAGVVLDEFIDSFYIPQDGNLEVSLPYPASIAAGLTLRLVYTSTHASGCTVKCNLYLHKKAV